MGMLARKGYGGGLAGYVVREALDGVAHAEDAAAEADDPTSDDGPAEDAPVWTAARSAARAAARSAVSTSRAGDLDDAGASLEVGEGRARPISRLRPPPGEVWVDDLP
jgi:regulatory protein